MSAQNFLLNTIQKNTNDDEYKWLLNTKSKLTRGFSHRDLALAISITPRKINKGQLFPLSTQIVEANNLITGWTPRSWRVDQGARSLLLLEAATNDSSQFEESIISLFSKADMEELIAIYQALPLLPYSASLLRLAQEGLRTNIQSVFNAIAHDSPFPEKRFPKETFNQMVLKALFIETPLYLIYNLDNRCNPDLSQMLLDYADERFSAGRSIPVELWRCVGTSLSSHQHRIFSHILAQGTELEKKSIYLALTNAKDEDTVEFTRENKFTLDKIGSEQFNWNDIGKAFELGT